MEASLCLQQLPFGVEHKRPGCPQPLLATSVKINLQGLAPINREGRRQAPCGHDGAVNMLPGMMGQGLSSSRSCLTDHCSHIPCTLPIYEMYIVAL